jgi:hypothetical protein
MTQVMQKNLESKGSQKEMKEIWDQLSRFALYEDYKGLYDKVVPPCNVMQE